MLVTHGKAEDTDARNVKTTQQRQLDFNFDTGLTQPASGGGKQ